MVKKSVDVKSEGFVLLTYPQTLIRALDRAMSAYEKGEIKSAHNLLKALANLVYPVSEDRIKEILDHIDTAEALYLAFVDFAVPVTKRGNSKFDKLYEEAVTEGQVIFDMARLRAITLAIRLWDLDGLKNVGALTMGDDEPIKMMLGRIIESLWFVVGREEKRENYEEMVNRIFNEVEAAFNVNLRKG